MEVGCQRHAPAALFPGKRNGTHIRGSSVYPTAALKVCGKTRLRLGSNLETSSP